MSNQDSKQLNSTNSSNTTYTIPVSMALSNNNNNSNNSNNSLINNKTNLLASNEMDNFNINLTGNLLNKQQLNQQQQQQQQQQQYDLKQMNSNFKGIMSNNNTNNTNLNLMKNNLDEEDEVDLLKDLLMKNLNSSNDPNFYGICMKCSEKIYGADNGLRAMDQLFHVKCFTCHSCGYSLQGQHFYAMENKSFCENCYMVCLM